MVWAKGKTKSWLYLLSLEKTFTHALEDLKIINFVLQYILLNSELTVSFLLLRKNKKTKTPKLKKKNKNKKPTTAKAEPIGWEAFSTDQKINLSPYTVFTNIISKCIYSFSRN